MVIVPPLPPPPPPPLRRSLSSPHAVRPPSETAVRPPSAPCMKRRRLASIARWTSYGSLLSPVMCVPPVGLDRYRRRAVEGALQQRPQGRGVGRARVGRAGLRYRALGRGVEPVGRHAEGGEAGGRADPVGQVIQLAGCLAGLPVRRSQGGGDGRHRVGRRIG